MNITKANTESFYQLHRFHESLNRTVRTGTAALAGLKTTVSGGDASQLLAEQVMAAGFPWGGPHLWPDASEIIDDTLRVFSEMAVVRVFSAFDDFLTNLEGEHSRHLHHQGQMEPPDTENSQEEDERVLKMMDRCGWDPSEIDPCLPLLRFFRLVRNCVAHRVGRATQALVGEAASDDLKTCLEGWRRPEDDKKLPDLPGVTVNERIVLTPPHAILASDVCYRTAKCMNRRMCEWLDVDGVVAMAAHNTLLADDGLIVTDAYASAQAVIDRVLSDHHRVMDLDGVETIAVLRRIGLWERCKLRHERLYGNRLKSSQ